MHNYNTMYLCPTSHVYGSTPKADAPLALTGTPSQPETLCSFGALKPSSTPDGLSESCAWSKAPSQESAPDLRMPVGLGFRLAEPCVLRFWGSGSWECWLAAVRRLQVQVQSLPQSVS